MVVLVSWSYRDIAALEASQLFAIFIPGFACRICWDQTARSTMGTQTVNRPFHVWRTVLVKVVGSETPLSRGAMEAHCFGIRRQQDRMKILPGRCAQSRAD